MPIDVTCPNGHALKVKDKYAGKTGLCPRCGVQMIVPALPPEEEEFIEMIPREKSLEPTASAMPVTKERSIFDDDEKEHAPAKDRSHASRLSASESLLSSGAIVKHSKKCPKCFEMAPLWHTRCLKCNYFFQQ